jgi:hypothetical protein
MKDANCQYLTFAPTVMASSFLFFCCGAFLVSILSLLVQSQSIDQLQSKTADENNAGMNLGSVDICILNIEEVSCDIKDLGTGTNDFKEGAIDIFEDKNLDHCDNFSMPGNIVKKLTVVHDGLDGWKPEWFRVIFDNGYFVQCNDGDWIDNYETHELSCDDLVMSKSRLG